MTYESSNLYNRVHSFENETENWTHCKIIKIRFINHMPYSYRVIRTIKELELEIARMSRETLASREHINNLREHP